MSRDRITNLDAIRLHKWLVENSNRMVYERRSFASASEIILAETGINANPNAISRMVREFDIPWKEPKAKKSSDDSADDVRVIAKAVAEIMTGLGLPISEPVRRIAYGDKEKANQLR